MIGQTIDRYQIVEQLGQGGMGVVYKARDTVLERFVAIKVLPPDKTSEPERRRRFLREAKAASGLNHPGIVSVHDVLNFDGQDLLVMELVEGETLEELLLRKRPPLGKALGLGIGIADALARAHAAGIVHRDLKPSNVMVTADGVKLLDFGLAKQIDSPFIDPEAPTIASDEASLTRERVILGTVGWMSPEQAAGENLDARSDIFAFGVVMYEMLTGQHPFRRNSTLETLAAIREEDPERPTRLVPALAPEAERAVLRCLRKDPSRRWQSVSDLGAVLEDLKEDTESGRRVITESAPRRRGVGAHLFVLGGAAILAVASIAAVALMNRTTTTPGPLRLERLTYDAGASITPTISPDGNLVAFVADRDGKSGYDIWVRHINQPQPTRLTDHPADDWHPQFSPDGSQIVFRSQRDGGGIYVVNILGGGLRKLAGPGLFPRFSPDGSQIIFAEDPSLIPRRISRMFRVAVDRGDKEPFLPGWGVRPPPASIGPIFSPDGRLVIFYGAPLDEPSRRDWWVAPVEGGEPWSSGAREAGLMFDSVRFPAVWLPGKLLFIAGTTIEGMNLYQAAISDDGRISGPTEALTTGPGMTWTPSVAADGRIALSRFSWVLHLLEVPLDPGNGRPVGPARRITDDAAPKYTFSLTGDGDRLVYSTYAGPVDRRRNEIVLKDRTTGEERVLVSESATTTALYPRLSAEGSYISWSNVVDRQRVAFVAPVDEPVGSKLCSNCLVIDFFADGLFALVDWGKRLSRIRIADGEETPVLDLGTRALLDTDLSRDDRWLAIKVGDPDGRVAIYAVPVQETPLPSEEWVLITKPGGWIGAPRWSADGNCIYYLSDHDDFLCVWGQGLDPLTKTPVGEAFSVVHAHTSSMQMTQFSKQMWTIEVGGDRLVFNASETSGNVYTAMLE